MCSVGSVRVVEVDRRVQPAGPVDGQSVDDDVVWAVDGIAEVDAMVVESR
jgi:hypothetical protein